VVSTIADRIPVTILTGFLGSGKTTLLRKLLAAEGMQRTAVVINEFGEIGLDHLLVKGMTGTTVVLQNGCICCTIRSDVQQGFRELVDGRSTGEIPSFDRIVLETTGLADPVPIVQTLTADAMLQHQTRLSNIITTVDAVHGSAQLREHPESLRQSAIADRIVVTKSDLANARDVEVLNRQLAVLNPTARRFDPYLQPISIEALVFNDAFHPLTRADEVRRWLSTMPSSAHNHEPRTASANSRHDHRIVSFNFRTEREIDWTAFAVWLSAFLHRYGKQVLRVKGLLDVPGAGPVVINAVQNIVHRPMHLGSWPDTDRSSRIVFIVEGLKGEQVIRSLQMFLENGGPAGSRRPALVSDAHAALAL
jgi:G3E family GTPase